MIVEKVPAVSLFVTPEFKESPWVQELCAKVGEAWVTEDELAPGHFGTYFGAMGVREYENEYVQDLYYLHELTHVRTLTYDPASSWIAWAKRAIDSELEASLTSECFAYLHIPGLREKAFPHVIWVDRFLYGGGLPPVDERRETVEDVIRRMENEIRRERIRALNTPGFDDFCEQQIRNYCQQNWQWCRFWAEAVGTGAYEDDVPAFRAVEDHMASPDRDATHQEWIDSVSSHTFNWGGCDMPFYTQAKAFAEVYAESNRRYGNWLLRK